MFCSKCGTQLPDQAKFCSKCGSQIYQQPTNTSSVNAELKQPLPIGAASGSVGGYSYLKLGAMLAMLATLIAMSVNWVTAPFLGAEFSVWSMFIQASKLSGGLSLYPVIYLVVWLISLGFILGAEGIMLAKRRQTDASTLGITGLVVISIMAIVWIIDASSSGYGFIVPTQAPYITVFLAVVSIVLLALSSLSEAE